MHHAIDNRGRSLREPPRDSGSRQASQTKGHRKPVCGLPSPGGHACGPGSHAVQFSNGGDEGAMAFRESHVRRMELDGRVLLDRLDFASLLHISRQVCTQLQLSTIYHIQPLLSPF